MISGLLLFMDAPTKLTSVHILSCPYMRALSGKLPPFTLNHLNEQLVDIKEFCNKNYKLP